jgi:HK97 family phage prohead protease
MTTDILEEARLDVPTDHLLRCVEFRAEESDDGLTLEGYAAVFGDDTEINSYEGHFMERISPGAFKRSLGIKTPLIQFDHGKHPLIGSIPIGVIRSIREDSHGLKVRARLSDNWLIQPVRDAIRDGAISGMSFRFSVIKDTWTRRGDMQYRSIDEVNLHEVGPVVFPAYSATTVGVRSRAALDALQDPEVRAEIAHILASGTDFQSLAIDPDPAERHSEIDPDAPAQSHAEDNTPASVQRSARLALAFADL